MTKRVIMRCACGHQDMLMYDLDDPPDFYVCESCKNIIPIRGELNEARIEEELTGDSQG